MKSFVQHINEAGKSFERQETSLVKIINRRFRQNKEKPFTIVDVNGNKIRGIRGAGKYKGRGARGSEPYTDVQLHQKSKKINLSNKGPSAPSVAGGGLAGLEVVVPNISEKLFTACLKWYKDNGYKDGDAGVDLYAKVNDDHKEDIVVGSVKMGGPIHYMYIGPMSVKTKKWDAVKKELHLNGNLFKAEEFADEFDIYYRVRKRRVYQVLDFKSKDRAGNHSLFTVPSDITAKNPKTGKMEYNLKKYKGHFGGTRGKKLKKGAGVDPGLHAWKESGGKRDPNRRVVVSKKPPANAAIVEF